MLMQRDREILRHIEKYGGMTIRQCTKIFYKNAKRGYDLARKRLKILCDDMGVLKYYTNPMCNERIYYMEKRISHHDVYLYDFMAELLYNNAEIKEFKREPRWIDGKYRSDAFIHFTFNGLERILCVEVDLTHNTNINKYAEIYETNEIQNKYGAFPQIIIIGNVIGNNPYEEYFDIAYLDYDLKNFTEKVLAI